MINSIQRMFNSLANRYDLFNKIASLFMDNSWRNELITKVNLQEELNVLDLGTGTGDLAFKAAFSSKFIVGVDFSEKMVQKALEKCLDNKISFVIGDIIVLPFKQDIFDRVISGFVMRNVRNDIDKVISEAYRILKPGGIIGILELTKPGSKIIRKAHSVYLKIFLPIIGRIIHGNIAPAIYLKKSINISYEKKEFKTILRKAGFSKIEIIELSGGIANIYTAIKD